MFNREERRKRKEYRKKLNEFKEQFRKGMVDPRTFSGYPEPLPWNALELWGVAFLIEETVALKTLTKVLIVFSIVLSVLTFILAYPLITGVLAGLK